MIRQRDQHLKHREPLVSILIVNHRTPKQITLCLRSLHRFTRIPHEIIVVDNASQDASLAYLRRLTWIRLIENPHPQPSHRNGLELARLQARAPWLLILHSDTFVKAPGWLETLLGYARADTAIIASQDRVIMPLASPLDRLSLWWTRRKRARRWARRQQTAKLISHCALFARRLFDEHGLSFDGPDDIDGQGIDCGEPIQRYCEQKGLEICWLGREQLGPLLWHFEAATLNLVTGRSLPWKRRLRARRFYQRAEIRALLEDESLDEV